MSSGLPVQTNPSPVSVVKVLLCLIAALALAVPAAKAQSVPPLKANDVVNLKVYGESDLDTQARIGKGGEASFPLIGSVQLAGLDLKKASELIRQRYDAEYLVDPKITLTLAQEAVEYVTVLGAVGNPGKIAIPASGRLDLASVVAAAGGLGPKADVNNIALHRADGSSAVYTETALKANRQIPLRPDDRIIVGESRYIKKQVMIYGPVGRPGPVQFPVDGSLDLLNAISAAGGFTQLANQKRVTLLRDGVTRVINVKDHIAKGAPRIYLQPDDVITVAERIF